MDNFRCLYKGITTGKFKLNIKVLNTIDPNQKAEVNINHGIIEIIFKKLRFQKLESAAKRLAQAEENELMELDQDIQSGDDESDEEIEKIVFDIQNFQNIQEERNDDESDHEWESDGEELEENIGIPLAQLFGMWEVCVSVEDDSVYNIYEYG
ncbi:14038_t:CDS:2, partial [Entrophospora sp. SA101]